MNLTKRSLCFCVAIAALAVGCQRNVHRTGHPLRSREVHFLGEKEVAGYRRAALDIAWPDVHETSSPAVAGTVAPRTLSNPRAPNGIRAMTLPEAVRIALKNNKVIRDRGGRVLQSPDGTPTIYDPAIRASDPRFGVEGALSAFDANFVAGLTWSATDRPVNNAVTVGNFFQTTDVFVFEEDAVDWRAEINKTTAGGGRAAIRQTIDYRWNNSGSNAFPSAYNANLELEFRQPLLRGGGPEVIRIAGPSSTPGVYNGVAIARINEDLALADLQRAVRDLVSDVEETYWRLYFAYRELGAQKAARDAAAASWRVAYARAEQGLRGGSLADVSQAEAQYHARQAAVQATTGGSNSFVTETSAAGGLYGIEAELRSLLGLPVNDEYLIRPLDEPVTAPFVPDWEIGLAEALTQRVELRRQKWRVQSRELELIAAKNFLLPQLDFSILQRFNGFGDDLTGSDSDNRRFANAFETITGGQYGDSQMSLQLSVPIGMRQGLAAVRNAELQLIQAKMLLKAQEEEVTQNLAQAFRALDSGFVRMQENLKQYRAAKKFESGIRELYEQGLEQLFRVLDAQRQVAEAETAYFRSAVDYTVALKQIELEKGTLLSYNNIELFEGDWPAKAYKNSRQRERERHHAWPMKLDKVAPAPFVDLRDGRRSTVRSSAGEISTGEQSSGEDGPVLVPPMETPGQEQAPEERPGDDAVPAIPEVRSAAVDGNAEHPSESVRNAIDLLFKDRPETASSAQPLFDRQTTLAPE